MKLVATVEIMWSTSVELIDNRNVDQKVKQQKGERGMVCESLIFQKEMIAKAERPAGSLTHTALFP